MRINTFNKTIGEGAHTFGIKWINTYKYLGI